VNKTGRVTLAANLCAIDNHKNTCVTRPVLLPEYIRIFKAVTINPARRNVEVTGWVLNKPAQFKTQPVAANSQHKQFVVQFF
jgi:hypothetical protein